MAVFVAVTSCSYRPCGETWRGSTGLLNGLCPCHIHPLHGTAAVLLVGVQTFAGLWDVPGLDEGEQPIPVRTAGEKNEH